jgi:NAD kinase
VITVDGNDTIDFISGDKLVIRKSDHKTIIADMQLRPFYERVMDILSR